MLTAKRLSEVECDFDSVPYKWRHSIAVLFDKPHRVMRETLTPIAPFILSEITKLQDVDELCPIIAAITLETFSNEIYPLILNTIHALANDFLDSKGQVLVLCDALEEVEGKIELATSMRNFVNNYNHDFPDNHAETLLVMRHKWVIYARQWLQKNNFQSD